MINIVEIDRLSLTRNSRNTGVGLPVHQGIYQRRFPYIGFPRESHFRQMVFRKRTCNPAYSLKIDASYYHISPNPFLQPQSCLPDRETSKTKVLLQAMASKCTEGR